MKTLWYREASRNNSLTLLSNPNGGSNASGANSNGGCFRPEKNGKIWGPESAWITLPAALGRQLLLCSVSGLSMGLRGKEI